MKEPWILDTHTLLWALYEPERLPEKVRVIIEGETNHLLLSDVSVLEITTKAAQYRLPQAGFSVDRIVGRILGLGVTTVAIHLEDIITSAKLPWHHADPLDRLLIAQAQRLDAVLLSKDSKLKLYDVLTFWD